MIYIKEKSLYGRELGVYNLDLIPTFCLPFLPVKQLTQNLESLNPPTFASDYRSRTIKSATVLMF